MIVAVTITPLALSLQTAQKHADGDGLTDAQDAIAIAAHRVYGTSVSDVFATCSACSKWLEHKLTKVAPAKDTYPGCLRPTPEVGSVGESIFKVLPDQEGTDYAKAISIFCF